MLNQHSCTSVLGVLGECRCKGRAGLCVCMCLCVRVCVCAQSAGICSSVLICSVLY